MSKTNFPNVHEALDLLLQAMADNQRLHGVVEVELESGIIFELALSVRERDNTEGAGE